MMKPIELVRLLIPDRRDDSIYECPPWPPDAFAVAGTLFERTAGYAQLDPSESRDCGDEARRLGREWATRFQVPKPVQHLWHVMLTNDSFKEAAHKSEWREAVYRILACADEACAGVGFSRAFRGETTVIHEYYELMLGRLALNHDPTHETVSDPEKLSEKLRQKFLEKLSERFSSLCVEVPNDWACVQPKARTSQVGCTMRTLTQNLALLPGVQTVRTPWLSQLDDVNDAWPFNLLVLPFPFRLDGTCFERSARERSDWGFTITQSWLDRARKDLPNFVAQLVKAAKEKAGAKVHGLVLPELALDADAALEVEQALKGSEVELFVSGFAHGQRNRVWVSIVTARRSDEPLHWSQAKHHRWCLDESQITRYKLGHVLTPRERGWWEDILLGEPLGDGDQGSTRAVHFAELRPGAVGCVLVCEDLARQEPILPAVRSIGPNLVISLLMDGPQLKTRWPARYAAVLADDPGSSVLTLTSLGMVRQSDSAKEPASRVVALWRDSAKQEELPLAEGDHGLLLRLTKREVNDLTFDRRPSSRPKIGITLDGFVSVAHPNPPPWAQEKSEIGEVPPRQPIERTKQPPRGFEYLIPMWQMRAKRALNDIHNENLLRWHKEVLHRALAARHRG